MSDQANRLRDLMSGSKKTTDEKDHQYKFSNRVITVTSGKGGVGKSNFTVNLGLELSKRDHKTVIIDADFGLANIEVLFGMTPQKSLLNVLNGENTIEEVIVEGPQGLKFISGGSGFADLTSLSDRQLEYLIQTFSYLDQIADVILIDTGAGVSNQVINLVKASRETIIITTPEPTALTDAYVIIKMIKDAKFTLPEMSLVINRVDNKKEGEDIYVKLNRVSHRFLGVELKLLGYIPNDDLLVKAVKQQKPVTILYPGAPSSKSIVRISKAILEGSGHIDTQNVGIRGFFSRFASMFER